MLTKGGGPHDPAHDRRRPRAHPLQRPEGDPAVEPPALDRERQHEAAEEEIDDVGAVVRRRLAERHDAEQRKGDDREERGDLDLDRLGHPPGGHPRHHRQRRPRGVGERDDLAGGVAILARQRVVEDQRERRPAHESDCPHALLQIHRSPARASLSGVRRQAAAVLSTHAAAPRRGSATARRPPASSHDPARGGQDVADHARREHPDQPRQDEAVVDHVLADVRRARAVELDRREVGRIRRQDVVAVAGGREGDDVARRHADRQRDRHHGGDRRRLRVDELGHDQQRQRVGPGLRLHHAGQRGLDAGQVRLEHRVGHPGDAEHRDHGDHAGAEHLVLGDRHRIGLGEDDDERAGHQHEHLDRQHHRQRLAGHQRPHLLEGAEHRDDRDRADEDPHRGPLVRRQLLVEQRGRFAVHELAAFRIGDQLSGTPRPCRGPCRGTS